MIVGHVPVTFSDDDRKCSHALSSQDSNWKRKRAKLSKKCRVLNDVYFALNGLRKDQPPRMRRASFLSLLSICASPHHRTLLHSQRLAKTIIDAILALTLNDPPTNLAAATLFYLFTIHDVIFLKFYVKEALCDKQLLNSH